VGLGDTHGNIFDFMVFPLWKMLAGLQCMCPLSGDWYVSSARNMMVSAHITLHIILTTSSTLHPQTPHPVPTHLTSPQREPIVSGTYDLPTTRFHLLRPQTLTFSLTPSTFPSKQQSTLYYTITPSPIPYSHILNHSFSSCKPVGREGWGTE
jgi:hypothetical protein